MFSGALDLYGAAGAGAPVAEEFGARQASHLLLSGVLAQAARYLYAGATQQELRAAFALDEDAGSGLTEKLATLEEWETERYLEAMG